MKVAAVILPAWSVRTAPLGLAYVATALHGAGHAVDVFELNGDLWRRSEAQRRELWCDWNSMAWEGTRAEFERRALPQVEGDLRAFVAELIDGEYGAVGFSVYSTNAFPTRFCCDLIRAEATRPPKLFAGGPFMQVGRLESAFSPGSLDAVVVGEGEATAVDLLARWQDGRPIEGVEGLLVPAGQDSWAATDPRAPVLPDELPYPDWDRFEPAAYAARELPLMMSRGCVAACAFCCENDLWGRHRRRSARHVFGEMERGARRHGVEMFYLSDSLLNSDHAELEELCDLIAASDVAPMWCGYARIDRRLTRDLLDKLRAAGCHSVVFGLESGADAVLRRMRKGFTAAVASRCIRDACAAGVRVDVSMIVGFPGESEEDFQHTLEFLGDHGELFGCVATGQTCGIPPGTALWEHPETFGIATDAGGRILYDDDGGWYTADGANTIRVRLDRLDRMRRFLTERGIEWSPRP